MNSISLTGFTERISGLAGRLREKLTGNDPSDDSGACRNDSDIPALKPDSVIKSDGNPPVFEYRFDRKNVTLCQALPVEEPEKSEEEKIRELNAFARERMKDFTYEDYKQEEENGELENFTKPVIHNRYNKRSNMTVVEFGPVYTTAVPEALKGNGNEYVGLEIAKAYIEKQREFLLSDPVLSSQSSEIFGDLRKMPFKPASADLLVASCCNPFYDKNTSRVIDVIDDMAEVLKPGGEAVIVPFNLENDKDIDESVKKHLLKRFEVVETHREINEYKNADDIRDLQVLRRRSG